MKKEDKWIFLLILVAIFDATMTAIGVGKAGIVHESDPVAVWFYNLFSIYGFYIFGIINVSLFSLLVKKWEGFRNFFYRHEHLYVFFLIMYATYIGVGWGMKIF